MPNGRVTIRLATPRIVIDTKVLVSALRSRRGAAYQLLSLIGSGRFEFCISVPLILEYEAAAKRVIDPAIASIEEIDRFLNYVASVASRHLIFFLWRPSLRDPQDEMVVELAVSAGCSHIITYNERDFANVHRRFGIRVIRPGGFLHEIGERHEHD